jgi:hypothetical protein
MDERTRERLVAANDPLLRPLVEAAEETTREAALETVLVDCAVPVVREVLERHRSSDFMLQKHDADDVAATVTLRLVRKLRATAEAEDEAIERLEDYVATLTYNAIYDHLRRRFPERTRLKNRLRYILTHDARFALWHTPSGLAAGLRHLQDGDAADDVAIERDSALPVMLDAQRPADALAAILQRAGGAVLFDALLRTAASLWNVVDLHAVADPSAREADPRSDHLARFESRQYLQVLWSEIRLLPPTQRAALLLNLRDQQGTNGAALFILIGIANIDDLAAAMEMPPERLAELWTDLPLDDLTIGSILGLRRQQIINLRKSARERLTRRMSKKWRR